MHNHESYFQTLLGLNHNHRNEVSNCCINFQGGIHIRFHLRRSVEFVDPILKPDTKDDKGSSLVCSDERSRYCIRRQCLFGHSKSAYPANLFR